MTYTHLPSRSAFTSEYRPSITWGDPCMTGIVIFGLAHTGAGEDPQCRWQRCVVEAERGHGAVERRLRRERCADRE